MFCAYNDGIYSNQTKHIHRVLCLSSGRYYHSSQLIVLAQSIPSFLGVELSVSCYVHLGIFKVSVNRQKRIKTTDKRVIKYLFDI